ncbi:MAG: monovalent cation/H(+) antiporter subunit G [Rhodospirillaceae bacterium]|jgi:multicomponent Na+:H+ antiporter subunit G
MSELLPQALDILSWILLIGGSVFTLIGAIGMLRLPDVFARMHGASLIDTMGVLLILLGLAVQAGWTIVTIKLALITVFVFFTSPTATHALAQAALWGGLKPASVDDEDEEGEEQ